MIGDYYATSMVLYLHTFVPREADDLLIMFFASYIKHVFMLFIVPFLCCFFQQDQSIVVCHFKNVTEQG